MGEARRADITARAPDRVQPGRAVAVARGHERPRTKKRGPR